MTIFSQPLGLSWKWNSVRSSLRSRREPTSPHLKIFELALSRIGVPAHQILHVGQSLYHDVIPAQSLGLATVWVNRPSARNGVGSGQISRGSPDLEVRSLAEFADAFDNPGLVLDRAVRVEDGLQTRSGWPT